MKKIGLAAALLCMIVSAGCETVKGVGRDITNTGTAVQGMLSKKGS